MTHAALLATVLRVWSGLHATPDSTIAEAIATAVEGAHVFDAELLAGVMAVYSWRESGNRMHPEASSWDAAAGRSCGVFQTPCAITRHWSAADQARYWVRNVLHSSLGAVDSSPSRARKRVALALELMTDPS